MKLDILVENCGRVNFGVKLFDKKGIFGKVSPEELEEFEGGEE